MVRILRAIRFLIVMIVYSADMMWRSRKMNHRDQMTHVAHRQKEGCIRLTKIIKVTTEVHGNFPSDQPSLLVSNHIGTLDPWILASHFEVAFVAKSEMGGWPVIGWVCRAVGIIFAYRRNVMKTTLTIDEIRARMRSGVAVMIFPEGTTSDGTNLLPFKTAGFESVSNMDDGYIVPVYFHVRTIKNQVVDKEKRRLVTWSAPQSMLSNLWQVLGLGPLHFVIRIGTPLSAKGKNRKELALLAQRAVEHLKETEEQVLLNS